MGACIFIFCRRRGFVVKLPAKSPEQSQSPRRSSLFWHRCWYQISALMPGTVLVAMIAALALLLYYGTGLSLLNPLLSAVVLGIGLGNIAGVSPIYRSGIQFSMKRILRLAVILLGLKLSLAQVLEVGLSGLMIVTVSSLSTFCLTCWLGKKLKVNRHLTQLIAAGTSICGASAVVATNAVVDSSEEDVTYAIALVTGLGTLAMVSYPLMANLLQLSPSAFGLWCGASIHEVAQVVAASFQQSALSGEVATITKLSRVLLIIPVIVVLSHQKLGPRPAATGRTSGAVPWFVLLFVLVILLNSSGLIAGRAKTSLLAINQFLLCMAMAAMGLTTRLASLRATGMKPFYLAGLSWLFLGSVSLMLIKLS
ncbi:YeiH family putative sulfate export transporter [filamentous cyanobacterium CCP5]|nr:YeiH family putative sulfate export transporter [filamentous cyanobacterium CCP5]